MPKLLPILYHSNHLVISQHGTSFTLCNMVTRVLEKNHFYKLLLVVSNPSNSFNVNQSDHLQISASIYASPNSRNPTWQFWRGGKTGSMYALSYQVGWYVHIYFYVRDSDQRSTSLVKDPLAQSIWFFHEFED